MGSAGANPARCSELLHLAQSLELHATRGIVNMAEEEPNNWDETSSRIDEAHGETGTTTTRSSESERVRNKIAYCDHVLGP